MIFTFPPPDPPPAPPVPPVPTPLLFTCSLISARVISFEDDTRANFDEFIKFSTVTPSLAFFHQKKGFINQSVVRLFSAAVWSLIMKPASRMRFSES